MKTLTVHILLYREDDYYIAHCLEFDLVAQGATTHEAFQNLLDAIELQAAYVQQTGDLKNLMQPAPPEYWQMLAIAEPYTPQSNGWTLPAILTDVDCGLVHG
jgi:predicted RNase H-like HicB family nuclease